MGSSKMPVPPAVARRAVEWMVELQSEPVSADVRRDWQQWRDSHSDHERAWQRIEAVNGRLRSLESAQHPAVAGALLSKPASSERRQAIKALSVLLFSAGGAALLDQHFAWSPLHAWRADERTAIGARRVLALADGTHVDLNTGSAVNVQFDDAARRLAVLDGEILVRTGSDSAAQARPFLVQTQHGTLRALGTRFAVRLHPAGTQLSVFDGAVEVRQQDGDAARIVSAGQQLLFGQDNWGALQEANEDEVAWVDGLIVASGMRLDRFVAELNRYSTLALSCATDIAGLRVSGSYRIDDVERVLDTLAAMLSLRLETRTRLFGRYRSGMHLARI